jgi:teichuronic acid biosynthesis glycosyltransferase TuaC
MTDLKSKNILYVTHSYNNFVKFQVEILAKQFNHVYVLVRHKPVTSLSKLIPVQEIKFHSLDYKIDLSDLPENITVIPTPIWYLPFDYFYKRLGTWHYNAVKKAVKKHNIKFDIVHSHILWSAGYAGMLIAKDFHVPHVVTAHGQDIYKQPFKDATRRKGITDVLKTASEIITVSQNNMRIMRELGIKSKVHVIPNGFVHKMYMPQNVEKLREELGLPKDKKIFLTVANLEHVKGYDISLNAISEFVKDNKDCYFVWVGGGPLFSKLKSEIKKRGLSEYILMTNFQRHNQVVKYQLCADYFLMPSRNEGVPTVLFESMACGLPFISTKVGGIPEHSRDFTGILVEKENEKELLEALKKCVETKWERGKIIENSKQYTWENICKKIESIYRNLC